MWHWHLLAERLRAHRQQVATVDFTVDAAGCAGYAGAVVDAVNGPVGRLVLVTHSFAGFCASLVCERVPVTLLVLLHAMKEAIGHIATVERSATSTEAAAVNEFFHDLPTELPVQARAPVREQSDTRFAEA